VAAGESISLVRHAHLLVQRQAGIRSVLQGVLFRAVHRHVIVAAHAAIDELDDHFLPNPLQVAISPLLERESGRLAATFFHGALVAAARGVRLDLIRRPKHDVSPSTVGLPPGDAGREVLVGIRYAPIVLFFELVFFCVRRGIAALPEGFNELVALFVVRELHEGGSFFVGDNPTHVLIQPLPISLAQLNLERLGVGLPLFFRDRALEWVYLAPRGSSRAIVIRALCVLVLCRGNGGKTHCHQASQQTNRASISKTCGKHRRAYLHERPQKPNSMFIGYNKASRSGLLPKDFMSGTSLLSALRIRVLRLSRGRTEEA